MGKMTSPASKATSVSAATMIWPIGQWRCSWADRHQTSSCRPWLPNERTPATVRRGRCCHQPWKVWCEQIVQRRRHHADKHIEDHEQYQQHKQHGHRYFHCAFNTLLHPGRDNRARYSNAVLPQKIRVSGSASKPSGGLPLLRKAPACRPAMPCRSNTNPARHDGIGHDAERREHREIARKDQREVNPASAVTAVIAKGGDFAPRRPSKNSAIKIGTPIPKAQSVDQNKQSRRFTGDVGKRQILPSPTANPADAKMNPL